MTQRINPGTTLQGIPAATWNRFCEVADRAPPPSPPSKVINPGTPGQAIDILVQNKTGADLTANYPILALTAPIFTIADNTDAYLNGVSFEADKPTADTKANFVVMQGKCPTDGICAAVIQGATWCKVNVTDATHTRALATNNEATKLTSAPGTTAGVRILWKESGTGDKWAIVLLGGPIAPNSVIHGKAVGASGPGGFTIDNITLQNGVDPRSDPTSTTETVTVVNPFGYTTDDNGNVRAEQADNGDWIVTDAECPA